MESARNILIAFILNFAFSAIGLIGGIITNSVAITSDSIHGFFDAFSVGISYLLERKSKKPASKKYTYGYARFSILGGMITNLLLIALSTTIVIEAIERIADPAPADHGGMIIFAVFGLVTDSIAAFVTHRGDSLNQKSVSLHMLEDVLSWAVILIGSIVMCFVDAPMIDPIMSIGVAAFILVHVFRNLVKILNLFLEKTPKNINLEDIETLILKVNGVKRIDNIRVISMDGIENYISVQVAVNRYSNKTLQEIRKLLLDQGLLPTVEIATD